VKNTKLARTNSIQRERRIHDLAELINCTPCSVVVSEKPFHVVAAICDNVGKIGGSHSTLLMLPIALVIRYLCVVVLFAVECC